ncbi:MAG: hypothetical protein K1000chlam2_01305 [Chlamydiae bacterium]|nr:hypothetical protein [Chlamydiota bacterium]
MTNITSITDSLPNEVLTEVASHLDIPDLASLGSTNSHFSAITKDPSIWRAIAEQINCPITQERDARDQVQSFVVDLRERIRTVRKLFKLTTTIFSNYRLFQQNLL